MAEILDVLSEAERPEELVGAALERLAGAKLHWQRLLFLWVCEAAVGRVEAAQASEVSVGGSAAGCSAFCARVMVGPVAELCDPEREKVRNVREVAKRASARWAAVQLDLR